MYIVRSAEMPCIEMQVIDLQKLSNCRLHVSGGAKSSLQFYRYLQHHISGA